MTDKQYLLQELKELADEYIQDRGLKAYRDDPVDYCEVFKSRYSNLNQKDIKAREDLINAQNQLEMTIKQLLASRT